MNLIERLRAWNCHGDYPQCEQAADEIERLTAENSRLRDVLLESGCWMHDTRLSDKGQCFCDDCTQTDPEQFNCDCPRCEALADLEKDDE